MAEAQVLSFPDSAAFAAWLADHAETSPAIWLKLAKKSAGVPSVTYAQALDEALCVGWIDSQKKGFDEHWYLQKFGPRGKTSIWSQVNRDKVAALTAAGRMKPAGLAAVQASQANGRWEAAYQRQGSREVPPDLAAELATRPAARAFFESLDSVNRYAIVFRLQSAVKPETRLARLNKFVQMLESGQKIHDTSKPDNPKA